MGSSCVRISVHRKKGLERLTFDPRDHFALALGCGVFVARELFRDRGAQIRKFLEHVGADLIDVAPSLIDGRLHGEQ